MPCRLLACACVLASLILAPRLRAQTAGGSAYLTTWTTTTSAPSGPSTLARPFRDAAGRVYVSETWTSPTSAIGPDISRLHRWDGRRWSHLDVRYATALSPTLFYNVTVSDLALIEGDTLVAATSAGPLKWTGTAWKSLYEAPTGVVWRAGGDVKRLAYDATRRRLYMSGVEFKVSKSGGGLSILYDQRGVGYFDLARRQWKGLGGYSGVTLNDLLVDASGDLIVAGTFAAIGGSGVSYYTTPDLPYVPPTPARHVARFHPADSTWAALGGGPAPTASQGAPHTLRLGPGGVVYAAGSYYSGSAVLGSVWRFDGSTWAGVDTPGQQPARSFELDPAGTPLIVTGQWTTHNAQGSTWRWSGSAWEEVAGDLANFPVVATNTAYSGTYMLKLTNAQAWVFEAARTCVYGTFEFAIASGPNGRRVGYACRATSTDLWRMQYPTGVIQGTVLATARTSAGVLYAGGTFSQIGALDARSLAVKVGDDWVPVEGGPTSAGYLSGTTPLRLPGTVQALASDGTGGVYVGGAFTRIGTATTDNASHMARFTPGAGGAGGTWASVGGGFGGSLPIAIYSLVPAPGGGVYVGGTFDYAKPTLTSTGSALVYSTGFIIWTGTAWQARSFVQGVRAILVGGDGALYVGGAFTGTRGVARWNSATSQWTSLAGGLSSFSLTSSGWVVRSLAFGPDGQLCAGGSFYTDPGYYDGGASGPRADNLACFNGTQWRAPATPFPGSAAPVKNSSGTLAQASTSAAAMPQVNALAGDGTALYVGGPSLLMRYQDGAWTNLGGATPPTVNSFSFSAQGLDVMTSAGEVVSLAPSQLPVELAAFTARADAPGTLALAWTTASETNNAGFYVEYQRAGAAVWQPGGFVPGAGTSTEAHAYTHLLTALVPGRYHLRLRQVDLDGSVHLSPVVEAVVGGGASLTVALAPNPARTAARLALYTPVAGRVRVALYDLTGREVARLHDADVAAGGVELGVPVSELPAGVYLVRTSTGAHTDTQRLVVVR